MFTRNRAEIKLRDYSLHWRAVAAASTLQKAGFGKSAKAEQIKSFQMADSFMGLQITETFKSAQSTESAPQILILPLIRMSRLKI